MKIRINLFQIFATATDDNGVNVDEEKSYKAHVEKLKSILSVLNDSVTGDDLTTFGNLVNDFYIENGIWYRNPKRHLHELKATKLYNDQYPELEDFVLFLEDRLGQLEAKNPNSRETKQLLVSSIPLMSLRHPMRICSTVQQNFKISVQNKLLLLT